MIVTVEQVENGYIVSTHTEVGVERVVVVEEVADDDYGARAAAEMLREVNDAVGVIGSRYDTERVHVEVRPGGKYVASDECFTVKF